ncbi:unnamed protein product [Bemisia tabaci]|uniref:CRAL-TRIO domain-containing protein n=2 Tax=Bemisia tabaci TaxID=7038 RepID=A0A9P0A4Q2_BEMTA|nr:PREDICTED: alpha-tocopherol transfer protein-like [Bemisia tabaci]CAH0386362.1 unnamed protein product [Bemisia tabaci]
MAPIISNDLDKYFSDVDIPDELRDDIDSLKAWLEKQPHLPKVSDRQLLVFFNVNQQSTERTKKFLECHYTIRTHAPDFFSNRTVDEFRNIADYLHLNILAGKTVEGHKLEVISLKDFTVSKFNLAQCCKYMFAMSDIASHEVLDNNKGWRILFDMNGFGLGHFLRFHPAVVKKCILYVQDALPLQLKGIHIINAIPLVHQILAMVKPIMKKEVYDLIQIHTSSEWESLYKVVPQELLPSDFGGKDQSMDQLHGNSLKKLEHYANWFKEEEKLRVDETKRHGHAKDPSEIFGIEGSFRKLCVD